MGRGLNDQHVQRQIAERALTKLADGGHHSRRDLFDDRRVVWRGGKNQPPQWQQRLLYHVRSHGYVERTGVNSGVQYAVVAGQQQHLRQLRANTEALCAILFSPPIPSEWSGGHMRKLTPEALALAQAQTAQGHSLREVCAVLKAELGIEVSAVGLSKALKRLEGVAARATNGSAAPPAPSEEEGTGEEDAAESEPEQDAGEPTTDQKLDALLRVTAATAQAVMALQQRFIQLEAAVTALRQPVQQSADILRQLQ